MFDYDSFDDVDVLPEPREWAGKFVIPDAFDDVLTSERVDELTYENRALLKHHPWIRDYAQQLAADGALGGVEGGARLLHDPVVVPHHRPGVQVQRHVLPADDGAVWRDEGTCWRCFEAGLVLEFGIPLELVVEPLFILWVRGDDRTIVEIGLCRSCAADLTALAPKFKALPRG